MFDHNILYQQEKVALRKKARHRRAAFYQYAGHRHESYSQKICASLAEFTTRNSQTKTKVVMAYVPLGSEVDIFPWLEKVHASPTHKLALPSMIHSQKKEASNTNSLRPIILDKNYKLRDQLHPARYGVLEPVQKKSTASPALAKLDYIIIPGLLYTDHGHRLGYGRGFYDHFLASFSNKHPSHIIGVFFSFQKCKSLPITAWDINVTTIITENGMTKSIKKST